MRIAIVGGGIAGALLAWRLRQASRCVSVDIFIGDLSADSDATGASGGMVRGFEIAAESCRMAAESLTEIRGSARLRGWAGYREIGSVYLLPHGVDPTDSVATVDRSLPGSATVTHGTQLADAYLFHNLPVGTIGIVERHAGYISPARLRSAVLAQLAAAGTTICRLQVARVAPTPTVRLADGTIFGYDIVVVAAGAWTPRLLAECGLSVGSLRTKQIQYTIYPARLPGLGAFVDDTTGLYGRPVDGGSFLLGLPGDRWDVDPAAVVPDTRLADEVAACAQRQLGLSVATYPPARTIAASDCYHDPPGLALRASAPGAALFTFTGGSGGAAKTVLAASRTAATELLQFSGSALQ